MYRLGIYALVAALILAGAGLVILSLFIWFKTKVWWALNIAPETGLERVHITGIPVAIPHTLAKRRFRQ